MNETNPNPSSLKADTMLDRVAKIIERCQWSAHTQAHQLARDIIQAMREPTEEMLAATDDRVDWSEGHGDDIEFNRRNTRSRWQAMIDEALRA